MADKPQTPDTTELAPASQNASIAYGLTPYLQALQNPDPIMQSRGGSFSVYAEVWRDDQVKSTLQQRILSVVSKPWIVEPGADDTQSVAMAEALQANLEAIDWDRITEHMLFGLFYGYAVGEVLWSLDDGLVQFEIRVRDRSRFRFDAEGGLYLLKPDMQYHRMPERKFWVLATGEDHGDNPYGRGLAYWLYWPVFFKRNDIKFWLIFLEKFGQPTAVGKMSAADLNNPQKRKELLSALQAISTEAAIAVPEGAEVALLEAARSGAADYEALKDAMDAAIAKIVLSQTMTTDNGSSRSQSQTHAQVRDMVVQADADLLSSSFATQVTAWWAQYNAAAFPGAVAPRVYRQVQPAEDKLHAAQRDQIIYGLGYEPTEEYVRKTYGDGWVRRQATTPADLPGTPQQQPSFAEPAVLTALKAAHRGDKLQMVNAAAQLASQYEGVIGARVEQLLNFAEETQDYETFRRHLRDLLADVPPQQTVEAVQKASVASRLLGAFRGQR